MERWIAAGGTLLLVSWGAAARAQGTAPTQSGTAPADLSKTVNAPTAVEAPASASPPTDSTSAALSAGGQFATGNSKLFAATGLGKFDMRRGDNAFGAQLIGNYSEAATPPSTTMKATTQNVQGKLRYDRYLTRAFAAFLQLTGTNDAFQAITFRLNVDPGLKLYFYDSATTKFWGEAGYDFEYDDHYTDSNGIEQAGPGGSALDTNNLPYVIKQQSTIQSTRLFAGYKHAFNKEVSLYLGLEYLQGLGGTGTGTPDVPPGYTAATVDLVSLSVTGSRINADALLAAQLGAGFSIGMGFSAKYNSAPLAGKQDLDTTGTLSLIYAYVDPAPKPPAPACPPPPPAPPAGPALPPPPVPPPGAAPAAAPPTASPTP